MIRNQFIYELNIDLDMEYITNLVMNKQNESVEGKARHHRLVKNDPYMSLILKRYPKPNSNLSILIKFF